MSKVTAPEEPIQILGLAQAGLSDDQIAQPLSRPVPTVRKWRRRAQRSGGSIQAGATNLAG